MARGFNGSNEYLYTSLGTSPVSSYPLTMACWFNSDITSVADVLIALPDNGLAGGDVVVLQIRGDVSGDPVEAGVFDNTGSDFDFARTSSGFSAHTWHHAGAVFAVAA